MVRGVGSPSEAIASDPNGMNGSVSYSYDPVGNRTQKVSTLPGYPGGLINYNANDQLSTDTYDANGNTTQSQGKGYVYDFENHLISANGVTYTYDGDGHRVSKTVNGKTITYATSDINPTGYAQVISETYSPQPCGGETQRSYVYGLEGVMERRGYYDGSCNGKTQYLYFVHDGHGSVRAVTDQNGAVTDTYDVRRGTFIWNSDVLTRARSDHRIWVTGWASSYPCRIRVQQDAPKPTQGDGVQFEIRVTATGTASAKR